MASPVHGTRAIVTITALAVIGGFATLGLAAHLYDATDFTAWATGISAAAVVFSVLLAVFTLLRDSQHRQVDRTIAFHEALTEGEVQAARTRLVRHLRQNASDGLVAQVSKKALDLPPHDRYAKSDDPEVRPSTDARLLLRFFERAAAANREGALNAALVHRLICPHAYWWFMALRHDEADPWTSRLALDDITKWGVYYEKKHAKRVGYKAEWDRNRAQDFGTDALTVR